MHTYTHTYASMQKAQTHTHTHTHAHASMQKAQTHLPNSRGAQACTCANMPAWLHLAIQAMGHNRKALLCWCTSLSIGKHGNPRRTLVLPCWHAFCECTVSRKGSSRALRMCAQHQPKHLLLCSSALFKTTGTAPSKHVLSSSVWPAVLAGPPFLHKRCLAWAIQCTAQHNNNTSACASEGTSITYRPSALRSSAHFTPL